MRITPEDRIQYIRVENSYWPVYEEYKPEPAPKVETKVFINGILPEHYFLIQELKGLIKELKALTKKGG